MPDYRRLISYLYAYDGGVKGKNTGFAKLDLRNGKLRIHVSVRNVYVGSQDICVYLLHGSGEIMLGRIFIRNGSGEYHEEVSAEDIEHSGISADKCYGLALHEQENAWQTYTTIWDDVLAASEENDVVTHAAAIDLADVTSETVREKKKEKKLIPETEIPQQNFVQEEAAEEAAEEPAEEPEEEPAEEPEKELKKEPEYIFPTPEEPVGTWQFYMKNYAKLPAFECGRSCEIVAVRPQDLGMMGRENWSYGNNSFLLHGYYRYHHLILARLDADHGREGFRYILGVPGKYYSNEKYMASMFGFPDFILARRQPDHDSRFGYWYADIHME